MQTWPLADLCDPARVMSLPLPRLQPPNERGRGISEIARVLSINNTGEERVVFVKRQRNFGFRDLRSGLRLRPTLLREFRNLQRLKALGLRVPEILCFQEGPDPRARNGSHQAVLVTAELEGYLPFDQALVSRAMQGLRPMLLQTLGESLLTLHRANLMHGCLYPGHILVNSQTAPTPNGSEGQTAEPMDLAFIDLEKMRRVWRRTRATSRDLSQLLRRITDLSVPEVKRLLAPLEVAIPDLERRVEADMARRRSRALPGCPY